MTHAVQGHNIAGIEIEVEVRLFNSLQPYAPDGAGPHMITLPAGGTVADVADALAIPRKDIYLAFCNGHNVVRRTEEQNIEVIWDSPLENGDIVALSGPAPFSIGYGAPIV